MNLFGKQKESKNDEIEEMRDRNDYKRLEMKIININRRLDKLDHRLETVEQDIYEPDDIDYDRDDPDQEN